MHAPVVQVQVATLPVKGSPGLCQNLVLTSVTVTVTTDSESVTADSDSQRRLAGEVQPYHSHGMRLAE